MNGARRAGRPCILAACLAVSTGCAGPLSIELHLTAPEKVNANRTFRNARVYHAGASDDGTLIIERDGVVLDLGGAVLLGGDVSTPRDQLAGRGIVVRGAKNVTIRNGKIRNYKVAIYAEDAPGLTIEDCDVSDNYRQRLKSTPDREHVDDWLWGHENDDNQWLRYGAGIYLLRCDGAEIMHNRARNGQNGICMVNSNGCLVQDNDIAFMSGWGLAMWRSSRCRVLANRFDYCVRGYSHGVYARGQDSTGILVYEQCNDNLFAHNSATHGGDGFFLYAGNETVERTGEGGCNRNVIFANDFSHAVANGIEATFSDGNVFVGNRLLDCRHGIWAGYSRNSVIAHNTVGYCDNGISIEHGRDNRIEDNTFSFCGRGVHIWWDDDSNLLASPYGRRHGGASNGEIIEANRFEHCGTAVQAARSEQISILRNAFDACKQALVVTKGTSVRSFEQNALFGGTVQNSANRTLIGQGNFVDDAVQCTGDVEWRAPMPAPPNAGGKRRSCGLVRATETRDAVLSTGLPAARAGLDPEDCGRSECRCRPARATPDEPRGKDKIFIDAWGPYDYEIGHMRVHPNRIVAWDEARFQVLGPSVPFRVSVERGDVEVDPATGIAPAVVRVKRRTGEPGATEFSLKVGIGMGRDEVHGVMMGAEWGVAFYEWNRQTDPRDGEQAWQKIIAAKPFHEEKVGSLDFAWGGRGPKVGLPADRFALVASATLELPAGAWTIRTISDDGVRVYLDGKKVIDRWTWHVPTEDSATVELSTGPHAFRVEYFEIDGHAQLQFFLQPCEPTASVRGPR